MISHLLEIKDSKTEGKGLFAHAPIHKGDSIWWFSWKDNRKITEEEMEKLSNEERLHVSVYKGTYIIGINDKGDFMNHSCDPNCGYKGDDTMVALRDIPEGEEITYDYATSDIRLINGKYTELLCNCKTNSCRGTIRPTDILDPNLQKKYTGHLPSWTLEYIHDKK